MCARAEYLGKQASMSDDEGGDVGMDEDVEECVCPQRLLNILPSRKNASDLCHVMLH